jgi:microcystin-dependent protein
MGDSDGNFPRYLAIPIDTQRDENDRKAHVLMSDEGDLVLRGVEKAWDDYNNQNLPSLKNTENDLSLKIENYNIDINNHDITNVNKISGTTCKFIDGEIGSVNSSSIITKGIESLSGSIGALTCDSIETKTLDATESITSKVNNVEGVEVGMPIGSIIMWPSMNPPEGWVECNGYCIPLQNDEKTVYSGYSEFQKLATMLLNCKRDYGNRYTYKLKYSQPTGKTCVGLTYASAKYFVELPNFKQRFPAGYNSGKDSSTSFWSDSGHIGHVGGVDEVTLTAEQSGVPAHTHKINGPMVLKNNAANGANWGQGWESEWITESNKAQDAAEAHENLPPYILTNFIIKYK